MYKITAKQTDIAGNESSVSDVQTVTIDKGALIKKISATTFNGTYKAGDEINGYIEFRGSVTLSDNFAITLNVINNGNDKKITKFTADENNNNKYNFVYTVSDGDVLYGDYLNVSAISGNVTYKGQSKTISNLPASNLANNREIKIITGKPKVKGVSLEGSGEDSVLKITYDRDIVKNSSGTVVFTQSETDYRVPAVLSISEYNDLKVKLGNKIDSYYEKGLNGATNCGDDKLTPDTQTKYILKFNTENNDTDLVNLFRDNRLHIVEVPVYVSNVSVSESNSKILEIKLNGSYALPVKGAEYSVKISENAVQDSVSNKNAEYTIPNPITAPGVEKPEIRIEKKGYTIENVGNLLTSNVVMPAQVGMKISCQTPGATIKYGKNERTSTHVVINDCSSHKTKTDDVTVPTANEPYSDVITLGTEVNSFAAAKGMKFAISAQASKGTSESEIAYEYAARTVLKFYIGNRYRNADGQGSNDQDNHGNFYSTKIGAYVSQLTIWIIGGDSDSGGNTIDPFPLSWGDPSNFKMMKLDPGTDNNNPITKDKETVRGKWYWITWDISAPTYHGFVAGDVPSDAQKNGPSIWYAGECFNTPLKSYYILYPGETLYMTMHDEGGWYGGKNNNTYYYGKGIKNPENTSEYIKYNEGTNTNNATGGRASYFFRWKNIGTR